MSTRDDKKMKGKNESCWVGCFVRRSLEIGLRSDICCLDIKWTESLVVRIVKKER